VSEGPSLYRRHRPRSFAEVVGQEHVVRTLSNAVERGRVHHAYLFVGSRGTGKTSMAKILAACLNCEHGPTIEPCGVCDACRAIASATSMDVIELDAASSNSVDDVRALRESVAYAPVSGGTKVYILDEAHMLSTAAWNAFLKTLEEPPPNTIFVLATTEAQKVLPTVVDRCHRFDFQRPTAEQVAIVLRRAADAENISIPPPALALLARHAGGSFRDALGTLEQLQTYSGSEIALEDVLAVLGISDAELLFGALDAVAAADPRAVLETVARASEAGREAASAIRDLEEHTRALLIVQTLGGDVPLELQLTPDHDARLAEQAHRIPAAALVRVLDLLAQALVAMRAGADGRTQLELALVKAASPATDATLAAALERIARLESGAPAHQQPAQPALPPPPPSRTPRPREEAQAPAPTPTPPPPPPPPPPPEHAGLAVATATATATVTATAAPGELTFERVLDVWDAVIETVRASNAMLAAVLEDARPVELADRRLVVAFSESASFLRRKAEERPNRAALTEAIATVTGQTLQLDFELRELEPAAEERPLTEEEWVARLKAEFDAEEVLDDDE
jgi:DNA polymerase-3 subunit gamma/tau